jgi:transposase
MLGIGIDVGKFFLDLARHDQPTVTRFTNDAKGIAQLIESILAGGSGWVLLEATGGYEAPLLHALLQTGWPITRINPRQARNFARASGQLAKTDAIDARGLADMAHCMHPRLARFVPPEPWQATLAAFMTRRAQVVIAITQQSQQIERLAIPELAAIARASLQALRDELAQLDQRIAQLCTPHVTPAWRSIKGLGPIVQASLMSLLPELGSLTRQQIAKLVGVAPLNHDSGTLKGRRSVFGGRAAVRRVLYMATLVAVRWDPTFTVFYQALKARGKPSKVALVAAMRKFIVTLNARLRDEHAARLADL